MVANRDVYGLREGEAWTVVGTGEDGVRLERRGETRAFAPSGNAARNLSLCESRPLPLRSGDEIVWTRNLRRRGLINGDRATVERIAGDRIDVRTHSGRALRFAVDDDDLRHIDHAWSSTVYRAQGLTRDNVIAVLDSASMMSDRAMLYVEMSRARDGFVLLTDDTEQLVSRLEREGETVSSALEAAGQAPWLEPDMAVTAKPALWPVLEDWRAHVQRAEEADLQPFHLVGCDALMARMGALAEKEALPRRACRCSGRAQALRRRPGHGVEVDVLHAGDCGAARADAGGSGGGRDGGHVPSRSRRLVAAGGGGGGRGLRGSGRPSSPRHRRAWRSSSRAG